MLHLIMVIIKGFDRLGYFKKVYELQNIIRQLNYLENEQKYQI